MKTDDLRFFKFAYGCLFLIGAGCFVVAPFVLLYAMLMDSKDAVEFYWFFRVVLTGSVSASIAGIGQTLLEILSRLDSIPPRES